MTASEICIRCLGAHPLIRCLYVKAVDLEFGGDFNSIKRVEFLTPADYGRPVAPAEPPTDYPKLKSA